MRQGPFRTIPQGQYSEVILGFFDILGFSNLTRSKCLESPNYLIGIFNQVDGYSKLHTEVEVRIVSDSIVLWSSNHQLGLATIVNVASLLQTVLLREGILIRGVIAKGKHFATKINETELVGTTIKESINPSDEVIVSPVLVHCVELEKKLTEPIIVLDESVKQVLTSANEKMPWVSDYLEDYNGKIIINGYFTSHEFLAIQHKIRVSETGPNSPENQAKMHHEVATKLIGSIRTYILNGLDNSDERIRVKWAFVGKRFNEMLDSAAQFFPELSTSKIEI